MRPGALMLLMWTLGVNWFAARASGHAAAPLAVPSDPSSPRLLQYAAATVGDQESQMAQPSSSVPPERAGERGQTPAIAAKRAKPNSTWPEADAPPAQANLPPWGSAGSLSFGMQVAYGVQAPVPANGSHINLIYAQPQVAVVLRNSESSRLERVELMTEGLLGGAVHPGGQVVGAAMLFRLEGRARGNTKPLLDWGVGLVATTINKHAYELSGNMQFDPQIGIGFEHFMSPRRAFVLEYRFLHLSDAGLVGRNVGVQCSVLTLGFRWLKQP